MLVNLCPNVIVTIGIGANIPSLTLGRGLPVSCPALQATGLHNFPYPERHQGALLHKIVIRKPNLFPELF